MARLLRIIFYVEIVGNRGCLAIIFEVVETGFSNILLQFAVSVLQSNVLCRICRVVEFMGFVRS